MLDLEFDVISHIHQRVTMSFLDVLILLELRKEVMNDYDVIAYVQNKFQISVEPESVHSTLNFLEKNELIKSKQAQKSRVYALTEKGEETVKTVLNSRGKILGLVLNILTG